MAEPIISELEVAATSAPMVLVLGETGAGKSHFINKLAGRDVVKESARLQSCTQRPELVEVTVGEQDFLLIDTPGFNDTLRDSKRSDGTILSEVSRTLTLQTQMGVKLRGILFLYDIHASRMTGDKLRQIEMIKHVCGPQNYSNVLLVTTHWPGSYDEEIEHGCGVREADLISGFWKDMIKGGSKVLRFYNDEDSAKAIIGSLAEKRDITLTLQEEMAAGRALDLTSAGAFIINARQADEAELKKKLKDLEAKTQHPTGNSSNAKLIEEVEQLQESIEARKASETQLKDDLRSRIRKEIRHIVEEARKRKQELTAANVINFLIGISSLTAQLVQTVLTAA